MSDAVQKTVAPKKKQGGNVVVSSLDRTKGVTSRKVTVASRESARPNPHHVSHGPFEITAQGLIVEATRGKGKARRTACETVSGPFEILGRSRNSVGGGWGLWLQWRDSDQRTHQRLVSAASLHGETGLLCQALASEGLFIEREKQKELAKYLNGAQVTRRATVVDHSGWHVIGGQQVFVLPNETIGSPDRETVVLDGAANAPYQARGSLNDWRAGVGTLAGGHSLPVLAISAALAGPLVYLVGAEGGGLHFFGASSRGKTTMLQAAASVWGRGGTPGFVRAWRATTNGLEGAAALASDTVLILDEMGVLEARDAAAAIYGLANGAGTAIAIPRLGSCRRKRRSERYWRSGVGPWETGSAGLRPPRHER